MNALFNTILEELYNNSNIDSCEISVNKSLKLIEIKDINQTRLKINNFPFLRVLTESDDISSSLIEANLKVHDIDTLTDFLVSISPSFFSHPSYITLNRIDKPYIRSQYLTNKEKVV